MLKKREVTGLRPRRKPPGRSPPGQPSPWSRSLGLEIGRRRFLAEDEIARLLPACGQSKNPYLTTIVTLALNTGMRKGEILGLEWERVDFARGVLALARTKNGEPAPRGPDEPSGLRRADGPGTQGG